jgi:hypothetical protein
MIGLSQTEETETAMGRIAHPLGIMLTVLTCSLVGQAEAQEYCVACSEPSAVYRCVIEGAQPRGGQSLQMLCVMTMAKQGGHATCSVKGGTVFDCNGAVKRVPWTPLEAPQQQPEQAQPLPWAQPAPKPEPVAAPPPPVVPASPPACAPTPEPAPASAPNAPPETMLELAKRANEDTAKQMKKAGETMQKAGETVKDATKKTWDCVISLFTRC